LNTKIIKMFAVTSLIFLMSLPTSADDQSNVQKAVDIVRQELKDTLGNSVPSLSVLIQTPKEEIFVCSVDDNVKPITKDTYFRFASNTKNFTATAILKMYQDGWLDYKAKITDNIPHMTATYVPPEWDFHNINEITIEQLLQHSAGVYDVDNDKVPGCYGGGTYTEYMLEQDPQHQFSVDEFVEQLTSQKLSYPFTPGTEHHYSNIGYAILSRIISRVYTFNTPKPGTDKKYTDKTYADYLNDHIVGEKTKVPLKTIHFPISASDSELPLPSVPGTMRTKEETSVTSSFNMSATDGGGNGYSTMSDLNKFIRSLMKGENVLSKETVYLMQTDKSPKPSYSLGCLFIKNLGYGHTGARVGYLSLMAYNPNDEVSVIALLPLFEKDKESFSACFNAMYDAAYAARSALGYSGKPGN